MPPKRTVILGQDSPPFVDSGLLCLTRETTNCHAPDWRLQVSGPAIALAQALRAMPATDFYTCRRTSLPSADSRPKHHNLYSPTGDPPKPGTGTTLLSRGGLSASPFTFRSPGPVLDATLPSFHLFRFPALLLRCAKLVCLGKRSRLCRRATAEEYPGRRRTKGAGRRRQPSPAPSFRSPPAPSSRYGTPADWTSNRRLLRFVAG
jgi:hypothetical protein